MMGLLTRPLREWTALLEAASRRLLTSMVLLIVALIFVLAAFAFLSVALYLWVAEITRPAIAALAVAGLEIFIALMCLVAFRLKAPKKASKPKPRKEDAATQEAAAARAKRAEKIDDTLAPLIAVLHEADMRPEEAALRLGAGLTKQVGPLALVAFALAAGFMFARRLTESKE